MSVKNDIESMLAPIKSFCSKYKKIYIYGKGYGGEFTRAILTRHGIKITGYVYDTQGGAVGGCVVQSIDSISPFMDECGIVVAAYGKEKEYIESKFDDLKNFLFLGIDTIVFLVRNNVSNDGMLHTYAWYAMTFPESDWFVRFIRHYFPNLDEKIYLYGVDIASSIIEESVDGIKIFRAAECMGDVEGNPHSYKKTKYGYCLPYVDLSAAMEPIDAVNYMQLPGWLIYLCKPEDTLTDIEKTIQSINSNHYPITDSCACITRHDTWGTRTMVYDNVKDLLDVKFAGHWRNNTDELVTKYKNNKIEYLKHFCFNLTPENMNSAGYCSEKLFDAFRADCIPLYHGDMNCPFPNVLNQDAIIFFDPNSDNAKSRQLIIDLMTNKKLYQEFINQEKIYASSAKYIYEQYLMGLYKRLEYIINRFKREKRKIWK